MRDRMIAAVRLGVTVALAAFVVISVVTAPPAAEDRAQAIGDRIRCPVCAGEPISNSPTQLARDMMSLVRQGVDDGLTDDQVIDSVLGAYGTDAQVLDPPFGLATLGLWLVPALVAAGGAGLVVARSRSRNRSLDERPPPGVVVEDKA